MKIYFNGNKKPNQPKRAKCSQVICEAFAVSLQMEQWVKTDLMHINEKAMWTVDFHSEQVMGSELLWDAYFQELSWLYGYYQARDLHTLCNAQAVIIIKNAPKQLIIVQC